MKHSVPAWLRSSTRSVFVLLLLGSIGCSNHVTVAPIEEVVVEQSAVVERLEAGRVGFEIREAAQLEGELREVFTEGLVAMEAGEYPEAIELFTTVIDANPGVSAPYINLAIAYRKNAQGEEALDPLRQAMGLVPGHPVASQEYGHLLRSQGRFEEARDVLSGSLEEYPEYYPLRKNLAILCDLYLNDLECAYDHYMAYSDAQPDDKQVKVWLSELETRLGQ